MIFVSLREDAEPDGDSGDVEGANQGLPSRSSIQLQPPSPPAVMELDKQGMLYQFLDVIHTFPHPYEFMEPSIAANFLIFDKLLHLYSFVYVQHKCIFSWFWSRWSISYDLFHCCFPSASIFPIVFVFFYVPSPFIWSYNPEESLNCAAQFQGRPRRKRTPRFLLKP